MRERVTVAELIEKLKNVPQDYFVTFDDLDIDLNFSVDVRDEYNEVDFHIC